ncbi:MAG: RNA polymerase sigma factor [Gammaproteobacteria bacterium]|nr:RNA polymerase sigma factor [Gammaproteobacteria bacterium]
MVSILRETVTLRGWPSHSDRLLSPALPVRKIVSEDQTNQALDDFLASAQRDAYRLCLAACHDIDESVDLVQEAMLILVKKYRDRPEKEWAPLFHRIVQNRIRDWFRRQKVQNTLLKWTGLGDTQGQIERIEASSASDPAISLDTKDTLSRIESAVRQLPYQQQQTFLLRSWKEMSVSETAKAMALSESSVKTHHGRALSTLRTLLSDTVTELPEASHE